MTAADCVSDEPAPINNLGAIEQRNRCFNRRQSVEQEPGYRVGRAHYSALNAAIGSTFSARRAGTTQARRQTPSMTSR